MKQFKLSFLLFVLMSMISLNSFASFSNTPVEVDGTYYYLDNEKCVATVTSKPSRYYYTGEIVIPTTINYNNDSYSVTSIGNSAFYLCTGLTSIEIPSSVTSIGTSAFQGCTGLTSIEIPNSVTSIGQTTFFGCSSLTSVEIPNGVTNIGYSAFGNCTGLTSITIPNSVTSIDQLVFNGCSSLSSIEMSNGVMNIGYSAFSSCTALTSIYIPNSVTSIGENAFEGCTNLKNLSFEDGQSVLIFNVSYPNSYTKNPQWFQNCPLDSLYIGRNIEYSFVATDNNQTYTYSPFREKESLRKVVFGDNVTVIPNAVFSSCSNLISVETPETMDSIGNGCFYECEKLSFFVIPHGIRTIGYSTFKGCKSLETINIPETVTHIEDCAFEGCEGLRDIDIPSSVIQIEGRAFAACTSLSDLKFRDGNASLGIREGNNNSAFDGCPISSIYLGRNIINYSHNYIYSALGSITTPFNLIISKYVTELEGGTFAQCKKILSITFEEGADTLTLINDHNAYNSIMPFTQSSIDSVYLGRVIVGKDVYYPNRTIIPFSNVDSSFVMQIGKNIAEIGNGSYNSWNISSVTIPNNVQKIGNTAFGNCSTLKYVIIEDGETNLDFGVVDKNYSSFYGCPIDSLYLGRNLTYSQYSPFRRNTGISSLVLGDNVTEIGESLFSGFKSLLSVDLPKNLTKIGKLAFYGCEGLTTLTIPSSVTEIGQQAFDLCGGLKTMTFEDGEEVLEFTASPNYVNNAFVNSPLEEIYLGRNIIYQNVSPFFAIESLKKLTLGSKATSLRDRAFAGYPNLKDVYSYSETVPTTGESVFTESYLPNATLHVPYSLYDEYRVTEPWSKFGNIVNFEGKYNLVYLVDGIEYKKNVIEEGGAIVAESEPTKEGYTFSGWSEIPEIMPAHDVTIIGSFIANKYKLTYQVDGADYKVYEIDYNTTIIPEIAPTKEGYTFSGWSELPQTMPAKDVVVTGTFTINSYLLTYKVDGETVKSDSIVYGTALTLIAEPTKEGYTFSGWSELPQTMPAKDVVVTGTFSINSYVVTFKADGKVVKSETLTYGTAITIPVDPTKEGYTFVGWNPEVDATVPAKDVTYEAVYQVNVYAVIYMVNDNEWARDSVAYGETIVLKRYTPAEGETFNSWTSDQEYTTMPAHDVVYTANITTGIWSVMANREFVDVYNLQGGVVARRVPVKDLKKRLPRGAYIIEGRKVAIK